MSTTAPNSNNLIPAFRPRQASTSSAGRSRKIWSIWTASPSAFSRKAGTPRLTARPSPSSLAKASPGTMTFTSADVEFTAMQMWKKILNYGSKLQLFLTAVDTPDPQTAIFRYERPMPLNLLLRALPDLGYISAKHLYESGDIRQNPSNLAPAGTGPFKFVKYERGQYIIADRNPDYWRPNAPYLDRIVWRVITDRGGSADGSRRIALQPVLGPDNFGHDAARQGQALHRLDQGQRGQRPDQHHRVQFSPQGTHRRPRSTRYCTCPQRRTRRLTRASGASGRARAIRPARRISANPPFGD